MRKRMRDRIFPFWKRKKKPDSSAEMQETKGIPQGSQTGMAASTEGKGSSTPVLQDEHPVTPWQPDEGSPVSIPDSQPQDQFPIKTKNNPERRGIFSYLRRKKKPASEKKIPLIGDEGTSDREEIYHLPQEEKKSGPASLKEVPYGYERDSEPYATHPLIKSGTIRDRFFPFFSGPNRETAHNDIPEDNDSLEELVEELFASTHEDEEKRDHPYDTEPLPYRSPGFEGDKQPLPIDREDLHHKPPHPIPLQDVVITTASPTIAGGDRTEPSVKQREDAGFDANKKNTSILQRLSPKKRLRENYDPAIHASLVDLGFIPTAGIEEVETYPVHPPYAYIRILYDVISHEYTYQVIEPPITKGEEELYTEIKHRLFESLDISTRGLSREETQSLLREASRKIIEDYDIHLSPVEEEKILYRMDCEFIGDGLIDAIMHDPFIEDISCDGLNTPIFVYHTRYESMKTTLCYTDSADLDSFVTKLAQRAGKYISIAEPILDATMSDGSRIQMTLGTEVTAHGSTFTIRKFREEPITPTDLIEWKTFSPLSIAFLWLAVESGKSCLFAGGTASGKTTSLNAISLFMPPLAKIITLEDTRELKLPHANWIPSVTRDSFDTGGRGEIDLYELLRAALRQRPEYLLVGEVRGREALTLFQAMSTGHITYSTIHADSVASVVHRLENPPMNVPRNMLSALNLVSIQVQARVGGQRIRRNKQIIEILDIDPRTNELITNEVFRWKPSTDEISYLGKSYILEDIMEERGWDDTRIQEELKRRQEVLEWMRIRKIRHYHEVSAILMDYFRNPDDVIIRVRKELYEQL